MYDKIYLKGKQVVRGAIMRSFYFSSPVRELLYRDGWRPNRRININHFGNIISSDDGYVLDSFSRSFLCNFGNLEIHHEKYRGSGKDSSIFSPNLALANSPIMREEYSEITKSSLCPVGVGYSEHLTYFLSPKGEMFGGFESYFCRIGTTVEDAFENIFFRKDFQTLAD